MMSNFYNITGVSVAPGKPTPNRYEVSAWATDTPETSIQVSLFVRALQKSYDMPYEQRESYFQIAGACHT